MNANAREPDRIDLPAPLDGKEALKFAARAWAWGWGTSAAIGLGIAATPMIRDRSMEPAAALSLLATATAISCCAILPMTFVHFLIKRQRYLVRISDVGVYSLCTAAAFPLQWALGQGRGEVIAFSALGMFSGVAMLAYLLYQRLTGITSWHQRYKDLAPLVPRRLGPREALLLAGYFYCYLLAVSSPLAYGGYLADWYMHDSLSARALDFVFKYAWLIGVYTLFELAFILKRHFANEKRLKLFVCFSAPTLSFGAAMHLGGVGLFGLPRISWEVPAAVFLTLFIFGMSLVGNGPPQRGREDGGDEPRK